MIIICGIGFFSRKNEFMNFRNKCKGSVHFRCCLFPIRNNIYKFSKRSLRETFFFKFEENVFENVEQTKKKFSENFQKNPKKQIQFVIIIIIVGHG